MDSSGDDFSSWVQCLVQQWIHGVLWWLWNYVMADSSPDALLLHSARMEKCAQSMLQLQFAQRGSQLETLDVLLRASRD